MRSPRSRRIATGLLAASALLVTGGLPASAGSPAALRVNGFIGQPCLEIETPLRNTKVTLTQKRGGSTLRTSSARTNSEKVADLCVAKLRIGDVLVVKQATRTRTLSVPRLTIAVHRDDTVTGRVPASQRSFRPIVELGLAGRPSETLDLGQQTAETDGTFIVEAGRNINGSDHGRLTWESPKGDRWDADSTVLPAFVVEPGSAAARIVDRAGRTVTLTLRSAGGTIVGTATATLSNTTKAVTFRKNGDPVTVKDGDRVSTSSAPGLELEVIDSALELDETTPGGGLTATCFLGGAWRVDVYLGSQHVYPWGDPAAVTGEVAFDGVVPVSVAPGGDPTGYRVVLECEDVDGFVQRARATFE